MKAIIQAGGSQFLVEKGDKIRIEFVGGETTFSFEPLMIVDKNNIVGTPYVKGSSVNAKLVKNVRDNKITSIRYKAKKRVNKRRGHRQPKSIIEITSVTKK